MKTETIQAVAAILRTDSTISSGDVRVLIGRLLEDPPPAKPPPEYLNSNEAASFANVSRWTISRWIADGKLKRVKLGNTLRIKRAHLQHLLDGDYQVSESPKGVQ